MVVINYVEKNRGATLVLDEGDDQPELIVEAGRVAAVLIACQGRETQQAHLLQVLLAASACQDLDLLAVGPHVIGTPSLRPKIHFVGKPMELLARIVYTQAVSNPSPQG